MRDDELEEYIEELRIRRDANSPFVLNDNLDVSIIIDLLEELLQARLNNENRHPFYKSKK